MHTKAFKCRKLKKKEPPVREVLLLNKSNQLAIFERCSVALPGESAHCPAGGQLDVAAEQPSVTAGQAFSPGKDSR